MQKGVNLVIIYIESKSKIHPGFKQNSRQEKKLKTLKQLTRIG